MNLFWLAPYDCHRIIRRATDGPYLWEQRCVLAHGHAGRCEPGRWVETRAA